MSRHRITGAALVAGIAGKPVAHSLSPVIHNAWLAAGDIDGAYVPFAPADAAGFEALVAAGRAGLIQGLNVTAPFKEQAFALADQATAAARLTASANILTFDAGRVSADSSDGVGLMLGLKEQAPDLALKGRPVVLLGAGGAARAEALAADLGASVRVMAASEALDGAALVINALSVQPDFDFDAVAPGTVMMDMTYKPLTTPFLAAARVRGLPTVDGLAMLIGQAAPSFRALFRRPPPPLDLRALLTAHMDQTA
jgi:shikimate dehydrogenase